MRLTQPSSCRPEAKRLSTLRPLPTSIGNPRGRETCKPKAESVGAGTFTLGSTVQAQLGDVFRGRGRTATSIVGDGFIGDLFRSTGGSHTIRALSLSGARADASCHPGCGRAVTGSVAFRDVHCFDNDTACAGPERIRMVDSTCDHNGAIIATVSTARTASCIKTVRGGSLLVKGSWIHDNPWNGLWCDFCDGPNSSFVVRDSVIENNGHIGIAWEVSGGTTAGDFALIEGNIIRHNNTTWRDEPGRGAGITCSDCADLTVRGNTFRHNATAVWVLVNDRADWAGNPGISITDNVLKGDAIIGPTTLPRSQPAPQGKPTV
jgi:Right handed beta helix region